MASFSRSFTTTRGIPIDERYVVGSLEELYSADTWQAGNKWKTYEGLLVTVVNYENPLQSELYLCLTYDNPTDPASWRKISPSEISWNDEIEPIQSESKETQKNILNNSIDQNSGSDSDNSISKSSTE